jgi:hypothetical protein
LAEQVRACRRSVASFICFSQNIAGFRYLQSRENIFEEIHGIK